MIQKHAFAKTSSLTNLCMWYDTLKFLHFNIDHQKLNLFMTKHRMLKMLEMDQTKWFWQICQKLNQIKFWVPKRLILALLDSVMSL